MASRDDIKVYDQVGRGALVDVIKAPLPKSL
jgi:hypothetical protein